MKIKMKLLLLCAAVAPFLMMTSSQQNGSRFGCVCAMEKGNSNEPNEKVTGQEDENVPVWLWDKFSKNKKILSNYASKYNTRDYVCFNEIFNDAFHFSKICKMRSKASSWQVFCFVSAVLEGLLASRGEVFDSVELDINKEFSKNFPFAELKKLTYSIWTQLKSSKLRLHNFYSGLAHFMHHFDSESFNDFICCLEAVPSPFMQLFIASLMNLTYVLNSSVKLDELINIMNNAPDCMDSEDVVESVFSCFVFDQKLHTALRNFYSIVFKQKKSYSADKLDYMVLFFNYLGSLSTVKEINLFADHY